MKLLYFTFLSSLLVPLLAPFPVVQAAGRTLSPAETFSRCYSQFVQKPISKNHPLLAEVQTGRLSASAACGRLVQSAQFSSSGVTTSTAEARLILKTWNEFHRSMTDNPDLINSPPQGADFNGTRILLDDGEVGLHFTRALFAPGAQVKDVLTSASSMEALRDLGGKSSFKRFDPTGTIISLPTVQFGNLIGVRPISENASKTDLNATIEGHTVWIHRSEGGGVLGTPAYLTANFGRNQWEQINGGMVMPRRYSKAIFKDFLCRELPVIRATDAQVFIQTQVTSSTPSFRQSRSCMQCHASIDPMAATARAFMFLGGNVTGSINLFKHSVSQSPETGIVDADSQFHLRPPNGRFRYRRYDGTLVDEPLLSIADLGRVISQQDDFYSCVASKYYRFMTGIQVTFKDMGEAGAVNTVYHSEVLNLGKSLKNHQSLNKLIEEVVATPTYQNSAYRSGGNR
jgi:hypothetical protein